MAIDWRDGCPFSPRFGDVYFSAESGLGESEHVFLAGNDLAARFAKLAPGETFTLGETGFGTGLNFLATWRLFEALAPAGAQLDYFGIEAHPLETAEWAAALAPFPPLAPFVRQLAARWRRRVPGWNRWHFAQGRVRLTLAWEDVLKALSGLPDGAMDAWFLDGFAPAKNPEMWSAAVCRELARASRPGATLATYTAAGWVRRNLAAAGFAVEKRRGFGRKREMTVGRKPAAAPPAGLPKGPVLVIGGGLAGTAAGFALARRGLAVTLLDAAPVLASGASGNPVGVLHLRLAAGMGALQRLLLAAWGHALGQLDELLPVDGEQRGECGLLQLAVTPKEARRIERLAGLPWPPHLLEPVAAQEAGRLAGLPLSLPGLWFPQGGWVRPARLAARQGEGLRLCLGEPVTGLFPTREGWQVKTVRGGYTAAAVVVANAVAARKLSPLVSLPLQPVRGQITEIAATPTSLRLEPVVCGEVYLTPALAGRHVLGASSRFDDAGTDLRTAEHAENLARLAAGTPALYAALGGEGARIVGGRAAVRCSAPGAMPIVGLAAPGLGVSLAHGTRGLITTGLAGEILAAALTGTLPPVPRGLLEAASPQRFSGLEARQGEVAGFFGE
jgi:tRNA 5-methylaminomethyl-2-thiouridine biosynthesis bifunctional protein